NSHLQLPEVGRSLAGAVRQLGPSTGVAALASDDAIDCAAVFGEELSEHAAHVLAIVVAGELGYDAYYTIPYDGGPAAAVIRDDRLRAEEESPLNRMAIRYPQLLAAMPVYDHRAALASYARSYGVSVVEESTSLRLTDPGGGELTATFDEHGRLAELKGVAVPKK